MNPPREPRPASSPDAAEAALNIRIEEASLNAWPALTQMLYDGWVVRLTHGFTRRANSVTPIADHGHRDLTARIRWCENQYARAGLPTLFRLPTTSDVEELERTLRSRGYVPEEATCVLSAPLEDEPVSAAVAGRGQRPGQPRAAVRFTDRDPWLEAYGALTGEPETARHLHGLVLKHIPGDCLFAIVEDGNEPVACGIGVVEDDLVGIFDVVTAAEARRRGHGRALIGALHARAAHAGARTAYLQMRADNGPASRLYADFGYHERYRYHYLRKA